MANYNFKDDLILGEQGENVVIDDLKLLGGKLIEQNKDNRYDAIININGKDIKYEIKTDDYCKPNRDTGNIFVESKCRGKFSGILVTQAKWFVTYFKNLNEIWYIQTEVLKKIIVNNNIPSVNFSGDKWSNTEGWLVPRKQFRKHFIVRQSMIHSSGQSSTLVRPNINVEGTT
jgi:hypothetical protein